MINVLFFARYRDLLQQDQLQLDWQEQWQTLGDVRNHLVHQGPPWDVLEDPGIMCARNQDMCRLDTAVHKGDEIAFFPTVTGG